MTVGLPPAPASEVFEAFRTSLLDVLSMTQREREAVEASKCPLRLARSAADGAADGAARDVTFCAALADSARSAADKAARDDTFRAALAARGGGGLSKTPRLCLRVVEADGNCLFRAVSHQLHGTEDYHAALRAACCDHIMACTASFAPFVPSDSVDGISALQASDGGVVAARVARMRHDREWGGNVEIYALAELTGRPVEIYSADAPHADPLRVVAIATTVPAALYPPAAATLGPDAPVDVPAAAATDGNDGPVGGGPQGPVGGGQSCGSASGATPSHAQSSS